jgi:hypothetical protein
MNERHLGPKATKYKPYFSCTRGLEDGSITNATGVVTKTNVGERAAASHVTSRSLLALSLYRHPSSASLVSITVLGVPPGSLPRNKYYLSIISK